MRIGIAVVECQRPLGGSAEIGPVTVDIVAVAELAARPE